ncbi:transposase [Candidatus Spongiihabitans sp.]|uniref:transposase n=1 Tax=Candidatus Spongiihabitans sp. TaxID=3101308 RepID=UPI003C7037FB
MRQTTLCEGGFAKHAKQTKKEKFLLWMERIIPWDGLSKAIEPRYPKLEGSGRGPVGMERMLRIHFMRHWLDLSGPGMEDVLYDLPGLRQFARIDLGRETAPDETTICKFRHILEGEGFGERLFH